MIVNIWPIISVIDSPTIIPDERNGITVFSVFSQQISALSIVKSVTPYDTIHAKTRLSFGETSRTVYKIPESSLSLVPISFVLHYISAHLVTMRDTKTEKQGHTVQRMLFVRVRLCDPFGTHEQCTHRTNRHISHSAFFAAGSWFSSHIFTFSY